jgi:hypothetical protein
MATVFEKLNLKNHTEIIVLNAPASFEPELRGLEGVKVRRSLAGVGTVAFALAFVTKQSEVDNVAPALTRLADGDAIIWLAYPKGRSKRYTSEINRDSGWKALGAGGFEGVRMVAIDEDWSALRFRRADYIKTMKRGQEWAMSAVGKKKAAKKK